MGTEARILADSISPAGHRLTTFSARFPRIILAEVNTHRMLSKSSASSRAIPVKERIAAVEADPFVPKAFGRNQKGMQPGEALDGEAAAEAERIWADATSDMTNYASLLAKLEVHKQYANRLLEFASYHTAIITGTDWSNFEHLRVHPHAQGEFQDIAGEMMQLFHKNEPHRLRAGEWHLPLVPELDGEIVSRAEMRADITPKQWLEWAQVSAARCGRVSFERTDKRDYDQDVARTADFVAKGHMAPLEHTARAMAPWELDACEQYEALFWVEGDGERTMRVTEKFLDAVQDHSPDFEHIRLIGEPRRVHYCGNFNGWIQLRKLIPNEADALAPTLAK